MAAVIPPSVKKFRPSIISLLIFVFSGALAVAATGIIAERGLVNLMSHWRTFVCVSVFFGFPFAFMVGLMMVWLYPVGFSKDGIYAYSSWGTPLFVKWQDVAKVRKFKALNLTWLRIYSKEDKKILWLPLFQSRPIEFLTEIREFAPPNNPIMSHLG